MFQVGDKVSYPMHGAGIISAIEQREILGECLSYYILHFPVGDMTVMVPVNNGDAGGLRGIISASECEKVLGHLQLIPDPMNGNWNRRYHLNLEKLRSGDLFAIAEVVCSLISLERKKGLSTGERRMLHTACQILSSELMLAGELTEEQIQQHYDMIQ